MQFIKIDEKYSFSKEIPLEKIYTDGSKSFPASKIVWEGTIKPALTSMEKTVTESLRYEEIQVFHVDVSQRDCIYDAAKGLFHAVKYPCVVEIQAGDATVIGADTFQESAMKYGQNAHVRIAFSHWLRADCLSKPASTMINTINDALNCAQGTIGDAVEKTVNAISLYALGGITSSHINKLIEQMLVSKNRAQARKIIDEICVPYYYAPWYNLYEKYQRRSSYHKIRVYDIEEVWYCFMKYEPMKQSIQNRRYEDMDDMIQRLEERIYG
ncbi:MAG: DUF4391 domain-containing protein [Clostridia bacterium]|nr:DUF4391 domain-containing protein [Clostridia bacterium]